MPLRMNMWAPMVLCLFGAVLGIKAQSPMPGPVDNFLGRPRVVVLSDIGNEPDDQMSFVRLLLYSNEFDIEGLIATTSTWQKTTVHPETMRAIIQAYGQVRPNLLQHAKGWPEAEDLDKAGVHRAACLWDGGYGPRLDVRRRDGADSGG